MFYLYVRAPLWVGGCEVELMYLPCSDPFTYPFISLSVSSLFPCFLAFDYLRPFHFFCHHLILTPPLPSPTLPFPPLPPPPLPSPSRARAATITAVCANMCCLLSVMLQPYMPAVSRELQDQLQVSRKWGESKCESVKALVSESVGRLK